MPTREPLCAETNPLCAHPARRPHLSDDPIGDMMSSGSSEVLCDIYCELLNSIHGTTIDGLQAKFPRKRVRRHLERLREIGLVYEVGGLWCPSILTPRDEGTAYRLLSDDPESVVFIDTETTGLNLTHSDSVLQLAVIDGDGRTLYDEKFKPPKARMEVGWAKAESIHGIGPADVWCCPPICDCIGEIEDVLSGAKALFGYNVPFDSGILIDEGVSIPPRPCADVMLDFAVEYGEWSDYHQSYTWQKLSTAAAHVEYGFTAHDALEDCRATLAVARWIQGRREANGQRLRTRRPWRDGDRLDRHAHDRPPALPEL